MICPRSHKRPVAENRVLLSIPVSSQQPKQSFFFFFFLTFISCLGSLIPEVKNACGILPVYLSLKITLGKCIGYVKWNTLFLKDRTARRLEQRIQVSKEINLQRLIRVRNIMEYASLIFSLKMIHNDRNLDFETVTAKTKQLL